MCSLLNFILSCILANNVALLTAVPQMSVLTTTPGWSGTATDCPLPDSTCWDIPGHPRMSQLCRQCKVPGTRYPGIPQDIPGCPRPGGSRVPGPRCPEISGDIPGCPRPGGSVRSQSPRSKMSWDIWGHPGMSQTWRQC